MDDALIGVDGIIEAKGLPSWLKPTVEALLDVNSHVMAKNARRRDYFDGRVRVKEIGIDAIPDSVRVDVRCDWPRKAVMSVAERSVLDGFVFADDSEDEGLSRVVRDNDLVSAYARHVPSQLVHGCMCATVGISDKGMTYVRFHDAEECAMIWDVDAGRIGSALVVADSKRTDWSPLMPVPTKVNLHVPYGGVVFERTDHNMWNAHVFEHPLDRPMAEAFTFQRDGRHPFGRSRITDAVMSTTDSVLRVKEYMEVAAAFYAAPTRWMMGLTEEQFDSMKRSKWSAYIGSWVLGTMDDEGNVPKVGQFSPASPQPYIDMLRFHATEFSGMTGVPLNSLGIVQDNPSSAEAIQAAREDICNVAESLNESNRASLRNVALMAMAVESNSTIDALTEEQQSVMAHFKPTMTRSISETADAGLKIAQADEGFADTDVFYEMQGFDQATIERIGSGKRRAQASATALQVLDAFRTREE